MKNKPGYCITCNRLQPIVMCDICVGEGMEIELKAIEFRKDLTTYEDKIFTLILKGHSQHFIIKDIQDKVTKNRTIGVKPTYDLVKGAWERYKKTPITNCPAS